MPTLPNLQLHCFGVVGIMTDARLHMWDQVQRSTFYCELRLNGGPHTRTGASHEWDSVTWDLMGFGSPRQCPRGKLSGNCHLVPQGTLPCHRPPYRSVIYPTAAHCIKLIDFRIFQTACKPRNQCNHRQLCVNSLARGQFCWWSEKCVAEGSKYAYWIGLYLSFHLSWVLGPFVHGKLQNLKTSVTFLTMI